VRFAFGAAGAVVGAHFASPWLTVPTKLCPPEGEGRGMCLVQPGYAPAATIFVACIMGALVLLAALRAVPRWAKRARDPEYRLRRRGDAPKVTEDADPLLLAAAWGSSRG
jgi:hypothetical protein